MHRLSALSPCLPVLVLVQFLVAAPPARCQTYHRQDRQYFQNMLADIRNTRNHVAFYRSDPVAYTNPEHAGDDNHLFWDVGFGATYALYGFAYHAADDQDRFRKRGIDFFLEPQAHMLLDFEAQSDAVINTDFRGGAGLRGRGLPVPRGVGSLVTPRREGWDWRWSRLSWRLRFFHESTHLGDEFVLDGVRADSLYDGGAIAYGPEFRRQPPAFPFQRYNVSYEAADLFLAVDFGGPRDGGSGQPGAPGEPRPAGPPDPPAAVRYLRLYGGLRHMNAQDHPAYLRYSAAAVSAPVWARANDSLRTSPWEAQYGIELFDELSPGSRADPLRPNSWICLLSHGLNEGVGLPWLVGRIPVVGPVVGPTLDKAFAVLMPDLDEARYGVVAFDHYWRSRYALDPPGHTLAGNYVVGLLWGDYFRADTGDRTFGLLLNGYLHRGPNPHGQFRSERLDYERLAPFLPELRFDVNLAL